MVLPIIVVPIGIIAGGIAAGFSLATGFNIVFWGNRYMKIKEIKQQFDEEMKKIETCAKNTVKEKKANGELEKRGIDFDSPEITEDMKECLIAVYHLKQKLLEEQVNNCKKLYVRMCRKEQKKGHEKRSEEFSNEIIKLTNMLVDYIIEYGGEDEE